MKYTAPGPVSTKMMYFGDNCFLNICYCYALELEILPWTQDFLKQCHAVCPILHTICDQVWTSIFTGMANPKLMTCQCHYSVFQDLFFFRRNGEDDAIQALRGEKGDSIQRRKWRENNKGETQRRRRKEEWDIQKSRRESNRNKGQLQNLPKGEQSFWLPDRDCDN